VPKEKEVDVEVVVENELWGGEFVGPGPMMGAKAGKPTRLGAPGVELGVAEVDGVGDGDAAGEADEADAEGLASGNAVSPETGSCSADPPPLKGSDCVTST